MSACWSNPPDSLVDLDYRANLNRLAQLAVPMLGDWCAIHVVDDAGDIVPVALAHGDPQKVTVRAGYRNSSPRRGSRDRTGFSGTHRHFDPLRERA